MNTLKTIRVFAVAGCLLATTAALSIQTQAQAQTPENTIGYQVSTSYFESNESGLEGPRSFLAFTTRADFDKVFGAAALMGQNSFLPDDAFKSKVVVAVVKRGATDWKYAVQNIKVVDGELNVSYKATANGGGDGAAFSSPLILTVNQSFSGTVIFIENGKRVGKAMLAGAATPPKTAPTAGSMARSTASISTSTRWVPPIR